MLFSVAVTPDHRLDRTLGNWRAVADRSHVRKTHIRARRSIPLRLEIFEERVLLSSGIGSQAAVQIEARKAPKPFIFNGKLSVKLTATLDEKLGKNTYTEVSPGFREKKPFTPMGNRVTVSGALASRESLLPTDCRA